MKNKIKDCRKPKMCYTSCSLILDAYLLGALSLFDNMLVPVCFFVSVDAMDMPFLNPYLDSIGLPSFRKGCNFAAAGSTILPPTGSSAFPFSFGIQVAQFFRFKARVLELLKSTFILICKNVLLFFFKSAKNAFRKVGSTNVFVLLCA